MRKGRASPGGSDGVGRLLLVLVGLALVLAGLFALLLGVTGRFLPHDERFLGMTAAQLCTLHGCRIVHFMVHDRVSFGGAVAAIGLVYCWLARSPLRQGEAWAWWALVLTGAAGFGSFLAYLGYGYLDTWHAAATLALLPCFVLGLALCRASLARPAGVRCLLRPGACVPWGSARGLGRACLLAATASLAVAGLTILVVGMTCVFVPEDLGYLGLSAAELRALNPRLVPLIAHDRAGFGGAVCCCGLVLFLAVWCARPSRSLWWVLCLAGLVGFGPAIGIHPVIGYDDPVHLAPAVLGAALYLLGLLLTFEKRERIYFSQEKSKEKRCIPFSAAPSLRELGLDLLRITGRQRLTALALPFACCAAYFGFAALGWWPTAILAVAALTFFTYGSTSHDLVHQSLGLPRPANDLLLCLTELLALRSGHTYRAAHLHHHARFPHPDDIEATAAGKSWLGALAEGPLFQARIWLWAVRNSLRDLAWIVAEGLACVTLFLLAASLWPLTPAPLIYAALAVMGSWLFPLMTAWMPHDPGGTDELSRTRAFRGKVVSVIALEHLYHLEHHLYPAVPHHHWPELARRLDPYLKAAGVKPIRIWF